MEIFSANLEQIIAYLTEYLIKQPIHVLGPCCSKSTHLQTLESPATWEYGHRERHSGVEANQGHVSSSTECRERILHCL